MENMNSKYSDKSNLPGMYLEQLIMYRSSLLKVPGGRSKEDALFLLKSKIADGEKSPVVMNSKSTRVLYWVSSVAAGLLILLGIWQIWLSSPETQIAAAKGLHQEQLLPDGSKVLLNADSRISFSSRNFEGDRHIRLNGEAFFDITKGSTFRISTKYGDVSVLGTSFNIYSRENSFKVSCLTGTVLVAVENQSVMINPGESALLSGKDLKSFSDSNLNSVTGWIEGEFSFIDSPLNFVFDEIERQFNVKFTGQKFSEKHFTGSFTNKNLGITLEIICIPMNLTYEIERNGKISVSEKTQ